MKKIVPSILFIFLITATAWASPESFRIAGRVVGGDGAGVPWADVVLKGTGVWTTTGDDGSFGFGKVARGVYTLEISCLGYVTEMCTIDLDGDADSLRIVLRGNSLALDEVVVTARQDEERLNTSFVMGRDALNHLQVSNVADVSSLLPGGKTVNPDLTASSSFSLRDGGVSVGNAAFGTAVEVDGVRLGNNASFGAMGGIDTRNISVQNIESVEVLSGVLSAEYGDLNSGLVRIHTRKGRTPVNINLAVNPRTWSVSADKGIALPGDGGVLNVGAEWTRATQKLSSPYTSYTRRGLSFTYSNTFAKVLRFEAGVSGNLGGMNSEDDPDAYTGEYTKVRDNVLRANTSLVWLLDRKWVTNLKFEASVNFNDNLSHAHLFHSSASNQPSVHAEENGYFLAERLPLSYFSDQMTDSKELDFAASVKYEWSRRLGRVDNHLKAGVQWKANGNAGKGEYYLDPALADDGYRPRPYSEYPYMHNLAAYIEDMVEVPVGNTLLRLSAGLRLENVFVKGTEYRNVSSLSPRLNASWKFSDIVTVRGGWGIIEKLPSFYILYPEQQYRDIQTFGFSHGESSSYVYYTIPYTMLYNENLRWQRSHNAELGIDLTPVDGLNISLVGYYNRTASPYKYSNRYTPFSYSILQAPEGFTFSEDPDIRVDSQTGDVYVRNSGEDFWTQMEVKVRDKSFFNSRYADNGADIHRAGVEMVVDFPEIEPIRTRFRLDANYAYTRYVDNSLYWYYQNGWSHTSLPDRSYQYVGIYATGDGTSVYNGELTHSIDANLTSITHIPAARIVITCRLEASLLKRSRNLSEYNGEEYAYNVSQDSYQSTGGSIYDGDSYTAIRPVAYMDLDGNVHPFTDQQASDPEFSVLMMRSANAYTFALDGYGAYLSANLSVTKEIGEHVSLSFYANNFINSRMSVKSLATGVSAVFTPAFYYGLTCRVKF
ncbi:MAG TPA: TonB-dependent receptor [Candidatus Coprenecus stercoravium]|uniref:TonB-dependent receptor n=1 Tax=Candidatus Coprenecus stercoravium TaxID=2840735 RepID=A0A9D2KBP9_9BACT|nr:TonB-dependent receptor [Candidatus Coprenecus stercoravium]